MTSDLSKLATVMIAAQNPSVMERLFENIAVAHPEILLEAASAVGLISERVLVPSILSFPKQFIDKADFDEIAAVANGNPRTNTSPKIEAIKLCRAKTGAGLKEAKDFVEHFFPGSAISYR